MSLEPNQVEQLTTWAEKRDSLTRELSSLSIQKEDADRKLAIALENKDAVVSETEMARGELKALKELISVVAEAHESQKKALVSELDTIKDKIESLRAQSIEMLNELEVLLEVRSLIEESTDLIKSKVDNSVVLSQELEEAYRKATEVITAASESLSIYSAKVYESYTEAVSKAQLEAVSLAIKSRSVATREAQLIKERNKEARNK